MVAAIQCFSPVDGRLFVERPAATGQRIADAVAAARRALPEWRATPIAARARLCGAFVEAMLARRDAIVPALTRQMGRPIAQAPGELRGFEERARHMIGIAEAALAEIDAGPKAGFRRFVRREPLGVVAVIAPWNYPYLTAVNAIVPAIMAGDAVILKHSHQTPLCAEHFAEAFAVAGAPPGLFQALHLDHAGADRLIRDTGVDFVCFTGSVAGGHAVQRALGERFAGCGLELGGKDPAYVRADADLDFAADNVVDGAYFNAGQSCCAIERVYVHRAVWRDFVDRAVAVVERYRLGDPTDPDTTLGPLVRKSAADFVRGQIAEAVATGAKALIDPRRFPADDGSGPYLAPQLLVDCDHSMRVMTEESFGPVVGLMPVDSDDQAIGLMNDSRYGLTASIWTRDADAAVAIGERVETGTWFMNRCDYLDPALAWTGVKDSGRGCTLSRLGYEQLTRPKSYHLRVAI